MDKFTGTLVVAKNTTVVTTLKYRQVLALLKQQDWKCAYCQKHCTGILAGAPTQKGVTPKQLSGLATMDHIVPLSKGGTNTANNRVAVCWSCNQGKGDKSLMQFLMEINQWDRFVHSSFGFRYLQHIQNELYMNTISTKEGNESMPKFAALARFTNKQIDKTHLEEETRRLSEYNEGQKADIIQSIKDVVDESPGLSNKELTFRLHEGGITDAFSTINKMVNDGLIKKLYIDSYWRYYPSNYKVNEVTIKSQQRDTGRDMKEAISYAREHRGETIQQLKELLTKAPGLTYDEIETALGKSVAVKSYFDRGLLDRTQIPGSKTLRYFLKGQIPKSEAVQDKPFVHKPKDQYGGMSIYSRAKVVLKETPWLTQQELQEAVGVQTIRVLDYVNDRKLKRVKTGGKFRYALPRTPFDNNDDALVRAVERFDKALGEAVEPEADNDLFNRVVERAKAQLPSPQVVNPNVEQMAQYIEQLALKYYWANGDFDLKKFVTWVKKPFTMTDIVERTKE